MQTARALVQAVDTQILGVQRLGQGLATSDAIDQDNLGRFHAQARRTLDQAGLGSTISLSDAEGRLKVSTAAEFGTSLPMNGNPELVRRVFAERSPVISPLFSSSITGQSLMAVGVPVMRNGEAIYALTVTIESRGFNDLLRSQRLPDGWITTIFDDTGVIVARSQEVEKFTGQKAADSYISELKKGDEGHFEGANGVGVPVLVTYARSPLTGWRVAVNIPRETLAKELSRQVGILTLGILVLFIIALALAHLLSQKIVRSFQALVKPAAALGAGDEIIMPRVEVKEAALVAAALKEAADLLESRSAALRASDRDLAERSRALQRSEMRLKTLTEHAPVAIAVFDRQMCYLAASRLWLKNLKLEDRSVVGACHYDLVPGIPETWQDAHRRALAGETLCADADRFIREDGTEQWYRWEIWPWNDDTGGVGGIIISAEDVTARRQAERQLRDSESRLALALRAGNTAVWEIDVATQRLLPADDRLYSMLGYRAADMDTVGKWLDSIHEDERKSTGELLRDVVEGKRDNFSIEARYRTADGAWCWLLCQGMAGERTGDGRATRLVGTHTDINARKLAEQRAREAALHDPLTGLPNRALVFEYGNRLLAAAQRKHGQGALLFIDLDRFKPINDLYGHDVGDRVLQEVSRRLLSCTRAEDLVGRLGGDEFVILLPHLAPDLRRASIVALHAIETLNRRVMIDSLELSLSASIGISYYPAHATGMSELVHAADLAMYQAKQSGRANFQVYCDEFNQRADEAYLLEARLKQALKHGRLSLHYQPVIDMDSGMLTGAEALVRLADDGQAVGPQAFIPVAEAAGLIGELGEWVVREACRQHDAWLAAGLKVSIAINVSPLQFREKGFAEKMKRIILDAQIEPSFIQIEVTESAVMENIDEAIAILNRIKSLGVKVALDDFGTGYSSLSHLSSLPLDKLKVDQSFVRRIGCDHSSQLVTEAIIALGRSLKLEIIGEGIESEDAFLYLKEHGCNHAQGYWLSRPLPADQFAEWCTQQIS
ncbi:bifunctional diguanylate cyclase/phosphodiesterase [Noviherbaspirillum album]|uniref:bifunctional diguanylate cyclase/phosphodiesterase n=1 Tax=Noviherbaspirillum album TaxID=3080276 RepID=UPI003F580CB1